MRGREGKGDVENITLFFRWSVSVGPSYSLCRCLVMFFQQNIAFAFSFMSVYLAGSATLECEISSDLEADLETFPMQEGCLRGRLVRENGGV